MSDERLKPGERRVLYAQMHDTFTNRSMWRAEVGLGDGRIAAGIGPSPFAALEELTLYLAQGEEPR